MSTEWLEHRTGFNEVTGVWTLRGTDLGKVDVDLVQSILKVLKNQPKSHYQTSWITTSRTVVDTELFDETAIGMTPLRFTSDAMQIVDNTGVMTGSNETEYDQCGTTACVAGHVLLHDRIKGIVFSEMSRVTNSDMTLRKDPYTYSSDRFDIRQNAENPHVQRVFADKFHAVSAAEKTFGDKAKSNPQILDRYAFVEIPDYAQARIGLSNSDAMGLFYRTVVDEDALASDGDCDPDCECMDGMTDLELEAGLSTIETANRRAVRMLESLLDQAQQYQIANPVTAS